MEIHHTSHPPSKNFKEYFLEFLMLFLAVTLGFFAESIREHFVEKKTEKKYIHSLLQDLYSDSSKFKGVIAYNDAVVENLDSSFRFLNSPVITDSISRFLYYANKGDWFFLTLSFNQRTISQLKSAGGFRLITSQEVSDVIVTYNNNIDLAAWLRQELLSSLKDSREAAFYIFNDFLTLEFDPRHPLGILQSPRKFELLTTDKKVLIPYANKLWLRRNWLYSYNGAIKWMEKKCIDLIKLTKEKYHISN